MNNVCRTWISAAAVVCVGTWIFSAAAGQSPASQPATPSIQPIAYFQQSCARCHGDYGSNYGDQFARNLDDAKLSKAVDDMCSGPGNAPLSGIDLQAEIAFHRALAERKPFICITKRDGPLLSGEVTPNATLVAIDGGKSIEIKVDDAGAWSTALPASAKLVATLKGQTTSLDLDAAFSQAQPAG